jgi:spermidine/putrescine transport system substrate-binding protein
MNPMPTDSAATLHFGINRKLSKWRNSFFQLARRRGVYYALALPFALGLLWGTGLYQPFSNDNLEALFKKEPLYVLAPSHVFPSDIIEGFQTHSKTQVKVTTADSLSEYLDKIEKFKFDVIVFKSHHAKSLINLKHLQKINWNELPNASRISKDFLSLSIDPSNHYLVPFGWAARGFLYPIEKWPITPKTISDVLSPHVLKGFRNPTFEDDLHYLVTRKMLTQSKSTSVSPTDISTEVERIQKLLLPPIKSTDPLTLPQVEAASPIAIYASHGRALTLVSKAKDWGFVLPQDGTRLWTVSMALSSRGTNSTQSYEFMNYILSPEVAPNLALLYGLATTLSLSTSALPDYLKPDHLRQLPLNSLDLDKGGDSGVVSK